MAKQQDHPVNFLMSKASKSTPREMAKGGSIKRPPKQQGGKVATKKK
jgi:hypothetical protein